MSGGPSKAPGWARRWATIRLVATKELIESLRDRRTLFVALILPVLIYPIVTLGLGPVISMQKRKLAETSQTVAMTGPGAARAWEIVSAPHTDPVKPGAPVPAAPVEPKSLALKRLDATSADAARADLAAGRVQLWVDAPAGFGEAFAAEGTGRLTVRYDASDDRSLEAWAKWRDATESAAQAELQARLDRQGLPEAWRNPLHLDAENIAPPEQTSAYVFGRVLALLLVLMTLTSSFYPAVDAVAGEKERGTMETLLVAPCGRTELVLGKFAAVLAVTLAAALLNLGSLALTSGPLLSAMGPGRIQPLQITWPVVGGILMLLVPMAALFSAVSLSLSTLARSVKEAQHYLSPLVMLVMPLAMVVILPNLPLTKTLAAVPITNAVLYFRDLMLGRTEWVTTVIVMASTFGLAALAIWASVLLFLREETLFRGPEGTGGAIRRPSPKPVPSSASAVLLFAASLAALWYAQGLMPKDIAASVLVQQLTLVLGPCLLLSWWLRVDVTHTFRVGRPSSSAWIAVAAVVPLGLALPVVGLGIQRAIFGDVAPDAAFQQLENAMKVLLAETSGIRLVALLAVLPALCEELVFRGFILTGLSGRQPTPRSRVAAVVLSAAFFALFHVYPEKWANTFVVGAIFAWIALRTGSILPTLVAHAIHNATAVLAGKYGQGTWIEEVYDAKRANQGSWLAGACAVCVAALLVIRWATRRGRPDDAARGTAARGT